MGFFALGAPGRGVKKDPTVQIQGELGRVEARSPHRTRMRMLEPLYNRIQIQDLNALNLRTPATSP